MEFLDINLTKDSSLLLHAIQSPFYWRISKENFSIPVLYSCFNNPYKKIRGKKKKTRVSTEISLNQSTPQGHFTRKPIWFSLWRGARSVTAKKTIFKIQHCGEVKTKVKLANMYLICATTRLRIDWLIRDTILRIFTLLGSAYYLHII